MFTALRNRYRRARKESDRGIALITVIGIAMLLFILVGSGLTLAQTATVKSDFDSNVNAALAAAYAGVADYEARLTNDSSYVWKGDSTAPFSGSSVGLSLPADFNAAFCHGQHSGSCAPNTWKSVPNSSGNRAFRYEVDNSQFNAQGTVRLLATGRSGDVTRSVLATVRQQGFLNYMYFTDFETMDPSLLSNDSEDVDTLTTDCSRYWYAGRSAYGTGSNTHCGGLIQFGSSETVNGPLHSNDAMLICGGATFKYNVSTSDPNSSNFLKGTANGCVNNNNANYLDADNLAKGGPTYSPIVPMPSTNTTMLQETSSADPTPGCLYTGPTAIKFSDNGKMTVWSPWTKSTYADIDSRTIANPGDRDAMCGKPGTASGSLGSAGGASVDVPNLNLIYVQSVPAASTDVNYWPTTTSNATTNPTHPTFGNNCTATTNATTNDLGYPLVKNSPSYPAATNATATETVTKVNGNYYYQCTAGDLFVQGTMHGQTTIAADHYVWLTGNLKYKDETPTSSDILGLDGMKAIWVWNPMTGSSTSTHNGVTTTTYCAGGNDTLSPSNTSICSNILSDSSRSIDAAMLSVNDTIQVQNYNLGSNRGALNIMGALAQKYRGTVGTVNSSTGNTASGYSKNYSYDWRLRNISPPRFQSAASVTWSSTQYQDVTPAYTADGTVH